MATPSCLLGCVGALFVAGVLGCSVLGSCFCGYFGTCFAVFSKGLLVCVRLEVIIMKAISKDLRLSTISTSLIEMLDVSYADLVRVFGEPNCGASVDNKVLCEWVLRTPDGVATIYNYKDGENYVRGGLPAESIREWHVGGRKTIVADRVTNALVDAGVKFTVRP